MEEDDEEILVSNVIPVSHRSLFEFEKFNSMQSTLVHQLLYSNDNIVVSAPTGSGKTVLHELGILRLLITKGAKDLRCVYIAPSKALCQQKVAEWSAKFAPFSLVVMEVTGDTEFNQSLKTIAKASMVVTTPEKWDSLTRSWRHHVFLLGRIDLFLLDEIHFLGEDRGGCLESVICRMKMLSEVYNKKLAESTGSSPKRDSTTQGCMRIIALSATLPNIEDIGEFLSCTSDSIHFFDETYRPVPLRIHTLSYGTAQNEYLFEKSLDLKVPDVISKYSSGRQVLIFCSSKNGAEALATKLSKQFVSTVKATTSQEILNLLSRIQDTKLKGLVPLGVGYHHAGIPADDRETIERLYLLGKIRILCSTTTLAYGINIPAHLVIIKGTNSWKGSGTGYQRTSKSDVIQMMGRAGRKGFDDYGVAVIMTSNENKEAICAEITESVITNVTEAITWLKSTFFYVRVKKSPAFYGFSPVLETDVIDTALYGVGLKCIEDLAGSKIIDLDSNLSVKANPEAHIMTRNFVGYGTMVQLMSFPSHLNLSSLIREISNAAELQKPLRRDEKKILNEAMKVVRYPLKIRVQDPATKVYVLLQIAVCSKKLFSLTDFALRVEQSEIVEKALRLLTALRDLCIERLLGCLLESATFLDRALKTRMWEHNYESIFMQCPDVSEGTKRDLVERGLRKIGDAISVHQVQRQLRCSEAESRSIVFFNDLCASSQLQLFAEVVSSELHISLSPVNKKNIYSEESRQENRPQDYPSYKLICYNHKNGSLLCYRVINSCTIIDKAIYVQVHPDTEIGDITCSLICSYVGMDTIQLGVQFKTHHESTNITQLELTQRLRNAAPKRNRSTASSTSKKSSKPCHKEQHVELVDPSDVGKIMKTPPKQNNLFDYFKFRGNASESSSLAPSTKQISSHALKESYSGSCDDQKDVIYIQKVTNKQQQDNQNMNSSIVPLISSVNFAQSMESPDDMTSLHLSSSSSYKGPACHSTSQHDERPELSIMRRKASELNLNPLKRIKASSISPSYHHNHRYQSVPVSSFSSNGSNNLGGRAVVYKNPTKSATIQEHDSPTAPSSYYEGGFFDPSSPGPSSTLTAQQALARRLTSNNLFNDNRGCHHEETFSDNFVSRQSGHPERENYDFASSQSEKESLSTASQYGRRQTKESNKGGIKGGVIDLTRGGTYHGEEERILHSSIVGRSGRGSNYPPEDSVSSDNNLTRSKYYTVNANNNNNNNNNNNMLRSEKDLFDPNIQVWPPSNIKTNNSSSCIKTNPNDRFNENHLESGSGNFTISYPCRNYLNNGIVGPISNSEKKGPSHGHVSGYQRPSIYDLMTSPERKGTRHNDRSVSGDNSNHTSLIEHSVQYQAKQQIKTPPSRDFVDGSSPFKRNGSSSFKRDGSSSLERIDNSIPVDWNSQRHEHQQSAYPGDSFASVHCVTDDIHREPTSTDTCDKFAPIQKRNLYLDIDNTDDVFDVAWM